MVRWEPGARERLQRAALELFERQGFEQTTAAEIADAVGLTERTFFRHFADKREVLFFGQDEFVEAFLSAIRAAPAEAAPMTVIADAVVSAAELFPVKRRPYSRARQRVIDANPPLRERERHKLAGVADVMAAALRERGVPDPAAALAAESGASVFGIAFTLWLRTGERRSLVEIAIDGFDELRSLVGQERRPG